MDSDILKFFGVMLSLVTAGLLGYAGISLLSIWRRRLERSEGPSLTAAEFEEIQLRLAQGAELEVRLAELEERLDFSERMLSRGQDTRRLEEASTPAGGQPHGH